MRSPLVSCIMPSKNSVALVNRAVKCFRNQTYPHKELIVIRQDIGSSEFDFLDAEPEIWPIYAAAVSVGELRNIAIRNSDGSIIAHWDDDDWRHPETLERAVGWFRDSSCRIWGFRRLNVIEPATKRAWRFDGAYDAPWVAGGTMVYLRKAWEEHPFRPFLEYSEDGFFLVDETQLRGGDGIQPEGTWPEGYCATIHPNNTSPKNLADRRYVPIPWDPSAPWMEGL